MPFGDVDTALRRLLGEALGPIEERLDRIHKQLGEQEALNGEYLTIKQAAQLAGVAPGTVRRWIRDDKLASCKAGRSLRVKRGDFELFMSGGAVNAEGVIDFKSRAAELLGDG